MIDFIDPARNGLKDGINGKLCDAFIAEDEH